MNSLPIQVITFDLDDTLWHCAPVIEGAEQAVFDWFAEYAPRVLQHFDRPGFDQLKQEVYQQHPELAHQITQVRIIALELALTRSGYSTAEAVDLATQAFAVFIEARHRVELFDDTVAMLEQLHPQYQLGVLTNGNADVARLNIGDFFDFAFAAESLNSSKPAPAHFHAAMREAGVAAEQIVHIGDHPDHDIAGARDAGCHAIWFNRRNEKWPGAQPEPLQVTSIAEIPAVIASLAQER